MVSCFLLICFTASGISPSNRLTFSNISSDVSNICKGVTIKDKKYSQHRSYAKIEKIFDEPNKTCMIPSGRPPLGPSGSDLYRRRMEGSRRSCKQLEIIRIDVEMTLSSTCPCNLCYGNFHISTAYMIPKLTLSDSMQPVLKKCR